MHHKIKCIKNYDLPYSLSFKTLFVYLFLPFHIVQMRQLYGIFPENLWVSTNPPHGKHWWTSLSITLFISNASWTYSISAMYRDGKVGLRLFPSFLRSCYRSNEVIILFRSLRKIPLVMLISTAPSSKQWGWKCNLTWSTICYSLL